MKEEKERESNEDEDEDERGEYGRRVSKMAAAQICQGIGFEAVKQSSLEALSQLLVQYISDLGKSATYNANLAGRSQSNVFDILKGLQDLGGHSQVKEISEFLEQLEIPFANTNPIPVAQFPVNSKIQTPPSFLQMGETPVSKHIPDWLPAFPDPHTYITSPLWSQRKLDLRIDKGEQARQRRKAERSLLNLQQRLLSNAVPGPPPSSSSSSLALPPSKGSNQLTSHVLVKQMFAPAIEAYKDKSNDNTKVRPVVHFKMKAGKKMLVEDLDVHLRSRTSIIDKRASFMGRDDDKDDKKRRAQTILRHSAIDRDNQHQHQQEVSQM